MYFTPLLCLSPKRKKGCHNLLGKLFALHCTNHDRRKRRHWQKKAKFRGSKGKPHTLKNSPFNYSIIAWIVNCFKAVAQWDFLTQFFSAFQILVIVLRSGRGLKRSKIWICIDDAIILNQIWTKNCKNLQITYLILVKKTAVCVASQLCYLSQISTHHCLPPKYLTQQNWFHYKTYGLQIVHCGRIHSLIDTLSKFIDHRPFDLFYLLSKVST